MTLTVASSPASYRYLSFQLPLHLLYLPHKCKPQKTYVKHFGSVTMIRFYMETQMMMVVFKNVDCMHFFMI